MKAQIKVIFNVRGFPADRIFDITKEITDKMESIGCEWIGQGTNLINWKRDISFELEIK